ncbi:phosphate/phosphite/phosphonate ABC transporter substrate-binding protein [Roseovarius salinarum]|uniref:phosphate/phosphite/phosphonate ABC transporter substrate-binding protein n=1 Tax=Roseovarius salinarum TaxID=1981892 RepID=UPI000C3226A1|nr:PhnD/SsuA/transferrin family substrate-binding protein [Roseovarius salinarum]
MIASLPMYDRPETAAANDRLWRGIRSALGDGPVALTRAADPWEVWQHPDLLVSQTCGYPYRARLHGKVALVGAPVLDLPGCPAGHYYSVLVARADDPRADPADFAAAGLAYNEALSQSGWAAPQNMARAHGYAFTPGPCTGSHRASAQAVAEGGADIAALDALSWRLMRRHDAFAAALRVVAHTPPTPALPYIAGPAQDPAVILAALDRAVTALPAEDRDTLGLRGVMPLPATRYTAIPNPPPP